MIDYSKCPQKAGIYKLTCSINGKIYIGKSINIRGRINDHKNCGKNVRGRYFENAVSKHGWDSFDIEILEVWNDFNKNVDNDELLKRESYYIELYHSTDKDKGYNRCKYSTDTTGITVSEATREKMRNRRHSEESKEKIRQRKLGTKWSEETREKKKMFKHSDETKEKIRQNGLGRTPSDETKEKIRRANTGKKHSEETKKKMRKPKSEEFKEKLRGREISEETRNKMRESGLGRKHSAETKEKMRQAKLKHK